MLKDKVLQARFPIWCLIALFSVIAISSCNKNGKAPLRTRLSFQKENDQLICTAGSGESSKTILNLPVYGAATTEAKIDWTVFREFAQQFPSPDEWPFSCDKTERYMSIDFGTLTGEELTCSHFQKFIETVGYHNGEMIISGKRFNVRRRGITGYGVTYDTSCISWIGLSVRENSVGCAYVDNTTETGFVSFPSKKSSTEKEHEVPDWEAVKQHLIERKKEGSESFFLNPTNRASCKSLFRLLQVYHDAGIINIFIAPHSEYDATKKRDLPYIECDATKKRG